jgi:hypothetical protein
LFVRREGYKFAGMATYRPKRLEPAVRLKPERLRAAIEYKSLKLGLDRLAVRAVANAVVPRSGSFRVRLQKVAHGRQWSCAGSEREALARYFGEPVTAKWLGGEEDVDWSWFPGREQWDMNSRALPGTTAFKQENRRRGDFSELFRLARAAGAETSLDGSLVLERALSKQIGRRVRKTRKKRSAFQAAAPQPPLYQLIVRGLAQDIESAWSRAQGLQDPEPALYPAPPLQILLSLALWRRLVFEHVAAWGTAVGGRGTPKKTPPRIAGIILSNEAEMNQFAAALDAAIRIVLRPFLEGREEVSSERIKAILSLIRNLGDAKPAEVERFARRVGTRRLGKS